MRVRGYDTILRGDVRKHASRERQQAVVGAAARLSQTHQTVRRESQVRRAAWHMRIQLCRHALQLVRKVTCTLLLRPPREGSRESRHLGAKGSQSSGALAEIRNSRLLARLALLIEGNLLLLQLRALSLEQLELATKRESLLRRYVRKLLLFLVRENFKVFLKVFLFLCVEW